MPEDLSSVQQLASDVDGVDLEANDVFEDDEQAVTNLSKGREPGGGTTVYGEEVDADLRAGEFNDLLVGKSATNG